MPAVIIQTRIVCNNPGEVAALLKFFNSDAHKGDVKYHAEKDASATVKDFRDSPPRVEVTVMEEKP